MDKKECFLDHKNELLNKSKIGKFYKGVRPWFFLKKNRTFNQLWFLGKATQKRSFCDNLDEDESFLDHNNELKKKFKKSKFSKGVNIMVFSTKNRTFNQL